MVTQFSKFRLVNCLTLLMVSMFTGVPIASAQLTDIASKPIAGAATVDVKPNIMLLMDTSASMGFSHMPDEVEGQYADLPIGYKSFQCNSVYYNPNTVYKLPKDAAGVSLAMPTFGAARYNYYSTNLATVDLATSFKAYDNATRQNQASAANDTAQAAYYYIYTGTQPLSYKTDPCTQVDTGAAGTSGNIAATGGNWVRKLVSSTSGVGATVDERQNFAIWYVYYRTRLAMTKSSLSLAFATLTDRFRVGFITVNPGSPVAADKYLAMADFSPTNKAAWYSKVFSQNASGSSPMREGLARVGRYYGGKQDGINTGMTGDPMQYSCQKNFTLMTTDGYWNTAAETKGPVKLDGVTLVGQQDGTLTDNAGQTPRPIWDGGSTSTRKITNKSNAYGYASCVGGYALKSTIQWTQTNTQNLQSTSQPLQTTTQLLSSKQQSRQETSQLTQSTSQTNIQTASTRQSTSQLRASTLQNLVSTRQYQLQTSTLRETKTQVRMSTAQRMRTTTQTNKSTSQVTQSQTRRDKTVTQVSQTVTQALASTSQVTQSTSRTTASTLQNLAATSRVEQTVKQVRKSTSQLNSYNGATELSTPTTSCTAGGSITCFTVTTGPTLVATCTPATADAGNDYTITTCATSTVSGPVGVASCTASSASSSNSYQTTTCNTVTTPATPVASCTPASPVAGNSYTSTTCSTNSTVPSPVASCSTTAASAANSYTATTCTPVTTGPTGVASCTASSPTSTNSFTTTSCGTANTGPLGVASCSPISPNLSNNYTTTTCSNNNSGPTFVASCVPQTAAAGNAWVGRTCSGGPVTTTGVSCTPQTATASNNWLGIACANNLVNGPTGVASCTAATASSANGYTATSCSTVNTGPTPMAVTSCTAATASSGNNWTTTTCPVTTTGPTAVSSCTTAAAASGNTWTATTCSTNATGPTLVASCTAATGSSSNSWTTTTCAPTATTATVSACAPQSANAGNSFTTIACSNVLSAISYVSSCAPGSTVSGGVTTICTLVTTGPSPAAACTSQTATSSNNWLTRTCATNATGPTLVASCTNTTAGAGNGFTATTCTNATTGPTPVAACTAVAASSANSFVATSCTPVNTGPTPIAAASCTPSAATAGNNWTTTTCPVTPTGPTGVSSCANTLATSGNSWTATTCNTVTTGPTLVASCTPSTRAASNNWTTTTCPAPTIVQSAAPVAVCVPVPGSAANSYVETVCSTNNSLPTPVASCTPVASSASNGYTTTSCTTATTVDIPVASCSPGVTAGFITTTCKPAVSSNLVAGCTAAPASAANNYTDVACSSAETGPALVPLASCGAAAAAAGNSFTATTCTAADAKKIQFATTSSEYTQTISNTFVIKTTPTVTDTSPLADVDGICYTPPVETVPPLPTTQPPLPSGCSAWPCTETTDNAIGGSNNSLADVAQYYYINDLRPESSMPNDVKPIGTGPEDDRATWQHMTTFGLGLGVAGTVDYQSDYKSASTGAFSQIRAGTKDWPAWPDLSLDYSDARNYNSPKSIDDFWHAAVNGRGQYFSAGNPDAVVSGLDAALSKIDSVAGAGGGAAVSSGAPVASDNYSYLTSFATKEWTGDLQARTIDITTGTISATVEWSARDKLDAMTGAACDNRKIFIRRSTATDGLANFTWNTKGCDSAGLPTGSADTGLTSTEQAYFGAAAVTSLGQYAAMTDGVASTANQRGLAEGANLVNFVRGQRGLEGFTANEASKLYRARSHVLSDIVGSVAAVVKAPSAEYADAGYSAFKASKATRTPMIYVGSNGGMLHAIYAPILATDSQFANAGKEAWSYIPQVVMPELYRLADTDYKTNHRFYVDGSPTTGDVYDTATSSWKTVLVGGLNAGGKGYYALDVTDPASPKSLWEFNLSNTCYDTATATTHGADCHVGLTFGRPVLSKLVDGTWVVLVTSGYNNVRASAGAGDGQGYLYVLNAMTGKIISKLDTGVGSSTNPSGLRDVNTYVANGALDNTALRAYGGDLLGNIWRFDINDTISPAGKEATLVATAKDAGGNPQAITTRLQLAEVEGKTMIIAATGKFLGGSDTSTTQTQSIYGFTDTPGASVVHADLRGALRTIGLTQVGTSAATTGSTRTAACTGNAANCALTAGWVVDLPESGERVNVDPFVVLGTVVFVSNVPSNSACQAGGHSWINYLNLLSGSSVPSSVGGVASDFLSDSLSVGVGFVMLPDGRVIGTSVGSDTSVTKKEIPVEPPSPIGRRVGWREIKRN